MQAPAIPLKEKERLRALESYSLVDTLPEKEFDEITRLASEICETPISTISLIDTDRQFFKSRHGLTETATSRDVSFCAHAINKPDEMMVIPDSRQDVRFADNPLVTGFPRIIFYAGVPLTNPEGHTLGTLCIIDSRPRELSARQLESLKALGNQVVKLFELRKKNSQLEESHNELTKRNEELEQFAYVVSHDIKSPLKNIVLFTEILKNDYGKQFDKSGQDVLSYLNKSSNTLKNFIDGILAYYKGDKILSQQKSDLEVSSFIKNIVDLLDSQKEFKFTYPQEKTIINIQDVALEQIFINLISNSIKYNDKKEGTIDITFSQTADYYSFSVKDNGSGIPEKDLSRIFDVFVNLGKRDRNDNLGSGIGLSTVKKLVERLGGELRVTSEVGNGSLFSFTLRK